MLKSVCVYEFNARLYQSNRKNFIFSFTVLAENGVKACTVLRKYLEENKKDVGLIYETVDCIWNVDSEYVVMDVQE